MEILAIVLSFLTTIQFADSLWREGDFFNAITEYKRAVYLGDSVDYATFMIGVCYEKRNMFNFASKYFSKLVFEGADVKAEHHLAYDLIKLRRYKQASIVVQGEGDSLSRKLYAISLGLAGEYNIADSILREFGFSPPNYPSNWVLKYPSYLIPGWGLLLMGDYKRALISFLFTSATGYMTYRLIRQKRYPETFAAVNMLFFRFYLGNIENALKLKRIKKKNYYKKVLEQIYR